MNINNISPHKLNSINKIPKNIFPKKINSNKKTQKTNHNKSKNYYKYIKIICPMFKEIYNNKLNHKKSS